MVGAPASRTAGRKARAGLSPPSPPRRDGQRRRGAPRRQAQSWSVRRPADSRHQSCGFRARYTTINTHIHRFAHVRSHARTHARTYSRTHARTHGRTDARTHGLTDSRTHGLTDSRTHARTQPSNYVAKHERTCKHARGVPRGQTDRVSRSLGGTRAHTGLCRS